MGGGGSYYGNKGYQRLHSPPTPTHHTPSLEPDEGAAISCSSSSLHTLMLDNKHISDLVADEGEVSVGYPRDHHSKPEHGQVISSGVGLRSYLGQRG